MASAARSASRAFLRSTPATSSFRPAVRAARFALPSQGFRASARRGYSTETNSGKSSSNIWVWAGLAVAGGAGAYFYLNGSDSVGAKVFVPGKEDYQKVYDAIAKRLADETDYDDGSYGPVSLPRSSRIYTGNDRVLTSGILIGPRPSGMACKWYL
jgi:cytochrome c peroxidase